MVSVLKTVVKFNCKMVNICHHKYPFLSSVNKEYKISNNKTHTHKELST